MRIKSIVSRLLKARPLRVPNLFPQAERPGDPRIFHFNGERQQVIADVAARVVDRHATTRAHLEYILNDAANSETRRLAGQKDDETAFELDRWRKLSRRLGKLSEGELTAELASIVGDMAGDIAGNFDVRVYRMTQHIVPGLLTGVMNPRALPRELLQLQWNMLDERLLAEGDIAKLRGLAQIGTLVLVPTHSSNLDSVALGYTLVREGLPPVVYGAGKNLFSNPVLSFFMHNLGAYRVDRRISASIYKDVLKTYSCMMLERGYHSLFFPGGTRSRSGMVERRLKLGLAGTAVEAFARNQVRGVPRPVFFVPVTINYALVLEAETLIADHLKGAGKARYIITDDESSRLDRMLAFTSKLQGLQSACVIRFADPIDPFCNLVGDDGRSLVPGGRSIDPGTYVRRGGVASVDPTRDMGYTRELGEYLTEVYQRQTVIMWTQLVAHVLYRHFVAETPGRDLFNRQRLRGEVEIPRAQLVEEIAHARKKLLELESEGRVRVDPSLRCQTPSGLLDTAVSAWQGYHSSTVVRDDGDSLSIEDPNLLLFYQNRLVPWAEDLAREHTARAAREIAAFAGV